MKPDPCRRTTCDTVSPHPGTDHLDPASDLYDGPEYRLDALPDSCQNSAHALLFTARDQGWDGRIVETALHELAGEILRLREQVAQVRVDKDRGIRAAMARAEDCVEHGADIARLGHDLHWMWIHAKQMEEAATGHQTSLYHVEDLVRGREEPLAEAVRRQIQFGRRAVKQRHARYEPPTAEQCAKAGGCKLPEPHAACEQLRDTEAVRRG